MRANGVTEAVYEVKPDGCESLKVAFALPPAGLRNRSGEAVNLDEGMGALELDPLGEETDDGNRPEGSADVAHDANLKVKKPDAAG